MELPQRSISTQSTSRRDSLKVVNENSPLSSRNLPTSDENNKRWQNILHAYYEELGKGGIKKQTIDKDLWNVKCPAELLNQASDFEAPDQVVWLGWSRRLESILFGLNNFTTLIALVLGVNSEVSVIVWGSIKLILKFARPCLPQAIGLLEELCRTLPGYNKREQDQTWTNALEEALSNFYAETLIFFARAIVFFRNNPTFGTNPKVTLKSNGGFETIIANLGKLSHRVEKEADMVRVTGETHPIETMSVVRKDSSINLGHGLKLPCQMIPHGLNPQFLCRPEEVSEVKKALEPHNGRDGLLVVAIYGLGGVGKTQLALYYANTSARFYDIILWVPAETQSKVMETLSLFAKKLGLSLGADTEDNNEVAQKLKDWLNTSGCRFLLIFDNVEKVDILLPLWPASENGSIIVTTRCPSAALKLATSTIRLESFPQEKSLVALASLTGMKPIDEKEYSAAESICRLLGGLPLAIAQIGGFITDRGYSYQEFLSLYRRSSAQIHARGDILGYDYNLSTVWDVSLQGLPQNAQVLQALLCFFHPVKVPERVLLNPEAGLNAEGFGFLTDEFDFGDALSPLIRLSLISRSPLTKSLSTHPLVQATVFTHLSKEKATFFLDSAIMLLSNGFPNTWTDSGHHQGHGWASWALCGDVLPHATWLMDLTKEHKLKPSSAELFAELIFRCGTHLWEKGQLTTARSFFTFGFSLDVDQEGPICNQALRLLGHIALDMARPRDALKAYSETLKLRLKLVEADSPDVADVYDSIACSYTEMGDTTKAFEYLDKAVKIHEAHGPQSMGRTLAVMAVTLLRAGKPDEALEALTRCWQLQGKTESQISWSKYPKHSGDIILLSRIQYAQGKRESAIQLASKSITMRKKILGDKSPRVADSMYIVAGMRRAENEQASAMGLLREIVEMSQGIVEMEGHLARALWTLAGLEEEVGNLDEAEALQSQAREIRRKILLSGEQGDEEEEDEFEEVEGDEAFQRLVGYMLW